MIAIPMVAKSYTAILESYQVILIPKIFNSMQLHKIKHINLYFFILFSEIYFSKHRKSKISYLKNATHKKTLFSKVIYKIPWEIIGPMRNYNFKGTQIIPWK